MKIRLPEIYHKFTDEMVGKLLDFQAEHRM